jgi:hypothetical protein
MIDNLFLIFMKEEVVFLISLAITFIIIYCFSSYFIFLKEKKNTAMTQQKRK